MKIYTAKFAGAYVKYVRIWCIDVTNRCTRMGIWPAPLVDKDTVRGFGFVDLIHAKLGEYKTRRFYGPITIEFNKEIPHEDRTHNSTRLD